MLVSFFFVTYLSFYFLRLHEYRPETADTSILSILLAICFLLYIFIQEKNLKTIVLPYLIGFFVWALLSHISFGYLWGTIDTANALYKVVILFLVSAALFADKSRLEFYMKFISICAFVMALHGIDQFNNGVGWTGIPLIQDTRIRYIGVFADPNDLGMLFLIAIPFYFYFLSKSSSILIKLLWLLAISVLLYGIYLTNSRGTLLGLFVLMGFYGWHKYSRVVVITLGSIAIPVAYAVTRLSTISSDDESARGRLDAWAEGFFMLRSDPLFGVGHDLFTDHHHLVAHSSYVQTFAEIGLIGYFFWIGMFAVPIYFLYKFVYRFQPNIVSGQKNKNTSEVLFAHKKLATAVLYSLIAYAVSALFISRSTQPLLFLMCGMSVGIFAMIGKEPISYASPRFGESFKPTVFISVLSIILIWISIKVFW